MGCALSENVEATWLLRYYRPPGEAHGGYALAHPVFVTVMRIASNSGSALAWQLITMALVAALLWRRRILLALFVIVTNLGSSLIIEFVKMATNRSRPVVDDPLRHEPGKSFPSGHAQAAVVRYAVLLLVVLPYLHGARRRVAVTIAVAMVAAIGFSRIALAAHYVCDVLAAYLLGLAWVVVMASVFHVWRRAHPGAAPANAPTADPARGAEPSLKPGSTAP